MRLLLATLIAVPLLGLVPLLLGSVVAMLGGAQWLSITAALAAFAAPFVWHEAAESRRESGGGGKDETPSLERWVYRALATGLVCFLGLGLWQGRDLITAVQSHSDWIFPGPGDPIADDDCARLARAMGDAIDEAKLRRDTHLAGYAAGIVHYRCVAQDFSADEIRCVEDGFRGALSTPEMRRLFETCGIDEERELRVDHVEEPTCAAIADRYVALVKGRESFEKHDIEAAEATIEGLRHTMRATCAKWTHQMKVCADIVYRHSEMPLICQLPVDNTAVPPAAPPPRVERDLTNATGGACATVGPRYAGFYWCSTKKLCEERVARENSDELGECVESEVWCIGGKGQPCGPSKKACDHVRNVYSKGGKVADGIPECELVDLSKLPPEAHQ